MTGGSVADSRVHMVPPVYHHRHHHHRVLKTLPLIPVLRQINPPATLIHCICSVCSFPLSPKCATCCVDLLNLLDLTIVMVT